MKRATMELGGHSPVLVFEDVDPEGVAKMMGAMKYRNAGQVCVSPTRFFVHEKTTSSLASLRTLPATRRSATASTRTPAWDPSPTRAGSMRSKPSSTTRRRRAPRLATGGKRMGNQGNFFQPTVLTDVPESARIMHEEPFGPVAVMLRFKETDEMLTRANKLPYGLASYAFTTDAKTATKVADALESGMVTINHFGIALPETPFGGVKDSGFGHEGGSEGLQVYMQAKFISHLG